MVASTSPHYKIWMIREASSEVIDRRAEAHSVQIRLVIEYHHADM